MASLYEMMGGHAIAQPSSKAIGPGASPLSPHSRSADEERQAQAAFNAYIASQQRIGDMIKRKPWDDWLNALPERPDLIDDRRGERPDPQLKENAERRDMLDKRERELYIEYEKALGLRKR